MSFVAATAPCRQPYGQGVCQSPPQSCSSFIGCGPPMRTGLTQLVYGQLVALVFSPSCGRVNLPASLGQRIPLPCCLLVMWLLIVARTPLLSISHFEIARQTYLVLASQFTSVVPERPSARSLPCCPIWPSAHQHRALCSSCLLAFPYLETPWSGQFARLFPQPASMSPVSTAIVSVLVRQQQQRKSASRTRQSS